MISRDLELLSSEGLFLCSHEETLLVPSTAWRHVDENQNTTALFVFM